MASKAVEIQPRSFETEAVHREQTNVVWEI